ncbi:hypothetical protein K474DRAFT_1749475, partial [Panus rudis PR-1116 ss-1]
MVCYGCGDKGHTMMNCPKLAELVSQGKIKRDDNGKLIMSDGRPIRRGRSEPIIQAVYKMMPSASTNFISTILPSDSDNSDSDLDSEIDLSLPSRTTKDTRRNKLDGVVIPPPAEQRAKIKGKQREVRAEKDCSLTEEQTPIDTHVPQFDPHNDDDIMED